MFRIILMLLLCVGVVGAKKNPFADALVKSIREKEDLEKNITSLKNDLTTLKNNNTEMVADLQECTKTSKDLNFQLSDCLNAKSLLLTTTTSKPDCCLEYLATSKSLATCNVESSDNKKLVDSLQARLQTDKVLISNLNESCFDLSTEIELKESCQSKNDVLLKKMSQKDEDFNALQAKVSLMNNTVNLLNLSMDSCSRNVTDCSLENVSLNKSLSNFKLVENMLRSFKDENFETNPSLVSIVTDIFSLFAEKKMAMIKCSGDLNNCLSSNGVLNGSLRHSTTRLDECSVTKDDLVFDLESLNSSYITMENSYTSEVNLRETCQAELFETRNSLDLCSTRLSDVNQTVSVLTLDIKSKDLTISKQKGNEFLIFNQFITLFICLNFSDSLDKGAQKCADSVNSVQDTLSKCTSNFDTCVDTKMVYQEKVSQLTEDLDTCVNQINETILADVFLPEFNFVKYARINPIVSGTFLSLIACLIFENFVLLMYCYLQSYLRKRVLEKENKVLVGKSATNLNDVGAVENKGSEKTGFFSKFMNNGNRV